MVGIVAAGFEGMMEFIIFLQIVAMSRISVLKSLLTTHAFKFMAATLLVVQCRVTRWLKNLLNKFTRLVEKSVCDWPYR